MVDDYDSGAVYGGQFFTCGLVNKVEHLLNSFTARETTSVRNHPLVPHCLPHLLLSRHELRGEGATVHIIPFKMTMTT